MIVCRLPIYYVESLKHIMRYSHRVCYRVMNVYMIPNNTLQLSAIDTNTQ